MEEAHGCMAIDYTQLFIITLPLSCCDLNNVERDVNLQIITISFLTEIPTEKVFPEPGEEGQEGEGQGHTPQQQTQQIPLPMGQPVMGGPMPGNIHVQTFYIPYLSCNVRKLTF